MLLDGGRVSDEGCRHLQTAWRNVTHRSLDVVRNPLDEVGRVLVLNVEHLFIDFLHTHATTEHGSHCQVPPVARVTGSHHVLSYSCDHGTWQPLSSTSRGAGHRQPSCSLNR